LDQIPSFKKTPFAIVRWSKCKTTEVNFMQCMESYALFDYGSSLDNVPLLKFKSFETNIRKQRKLWMGTVFNLRKESNYPNLFTGI
jgi:hypothetical protein